MLSCSVRTQQVQAGRQYLDNRPCQDCQGPRAELFQNLSEEPVANYVICPEMALRPARENAVLSLQHQLLAPTLLRSEFLALLYRMVRNGEMTKQAAEEHLDFVRKLRIRMLGDRVLQQVAGTIADKLGWPDTFDAEDVGLTNLRADACVALNHNIGTAAADIVAVAPYEALQR